MRWDVTKSGNGERGTGNGERGTGNREQESGNECTAVTHLRIQIGGQRERKGGQFGRSVKVVNVSFNRLCP